LELLSECGVRYVFGNPGTTELPFMDELVQDSRFQFILGLQEVPVMAMADGYAMASRTLGVVNLHISCGLGNAMGMLYNAYREGTPLLLTAGQQDRRFRFEEPILGSDMVSVAKPWTKWSYEVERLGDLPSAVRRAVQTAMTPPTGPVFLSLPIDLQMEEADGLDLSPPRLLNTRIRPPRAELERAARILAEARNPALLIGSRLVETGAVADVVQLAELLGAPAISESGTTHGRLSFPSDHPLYAPGLPLWAPEVRERLQEFDVIFAAGLDLLRLYVYFEPNRAVPEHIRLIHLDPDPWQLGKNYPTEVGLLGDYQAGLAELNDILRTTLNATQRELMARRAQDRQQLIQQGRDELAARAERERDLRPLTGLTLMHSLSRALLPQTAVIEEAVTTTNTYLERFGALQEPTGYFGHRGWALGWGIGCTIGAKLAWPDRPVLGIIGDGAAMYGIQGLWTAARERLPVVFVIANNAQYLILKVGAKGLHLPAACADKFAGMDLVNPEVDYVNLARALGVDACRVNEPDEICERVRAALQGDRPQLIEVPIQRGGISKLQY